MKNDIKILVVIINILIVASFLRVSNYSVLNEIINILFYGLTLTTIFVVVGILSIRKKVKKEVLIMSSLFCLFAIVNVISTVWNGYSHSSAIRLYQVVSVLSVFILVVTVVSETNIVNYIWMIASVIGVFTVLAFLGWVFQRQMGYSGIFNNPNSLGTFSFIALPFLVFAEKTARKKTTKYLWSGLAVLTVLLCFVSGARTSIISVFIFLLFLYLIPIISKKQIAYKLFFLLIITVPALFLLFILYDEGFLLYYAETISGFLSDKERLLSGRDVLWLSLIDLIVTRPLLGWGAGATPSDFIDTGLSAHNLYIQVALQSGVTGLLIIVTIMYRIWSYMYIKINESIVKTSASFLPAMMFHQMFEISLTQNNLTFGFFMWVILAIGVGVSAKNLVD